MGIRNEFRKQLATYIMASLGLVAGLAWNDAIKSLIENVFPLSQSGNWPIKMAYASILTVLVVIFSIVITRIDSKRITK